MRIFSTFFSRERREDAAVLHHLLDNLPLVDFRDISNLRRSRNRFSNLVNGCGNSPSVVCRFTCRAQLVFEMRRILMVRYNSSVDFLILDDD